VDRGASTQPCLWQVTVRLASRSASPRHCSAAVLIAVSHFPIAACSLALL
jgi:hypothetical protein